MKSAAVTIQAVLTPKPEHRQDVLEGMRQMAAKSRQESGCLIYDIYEDQNGGRIHLQERYTDLDAVQAHRESAHYKAYRDQSAQWLTALPQVTLMYDVDVAPNIQS